MVKAYRLRIRPNVPFPYRSGLVPRGAEHFRERDPGQMRAALALRELRLDICPAEPVRSSYGIVLEVPHARAAVLAAQETGPRRHAYRVVGHSVLEADPREARALVLRQRPP